MDVLDLGELVVVDRRERQHELAGVRLVVDQQVRLGAERAAERRDELLADRVQRRVGHLREELAEVVEQQPRPRGEHRDRGVGAHRAQRLGPGRRHRAQQDPQLFLGVAEGLLPPQHRAAGVGDVLALGKVVQPHEVVLEHARVRQPRRELGLDRAVLEHAADAGVHQEHLPGREAALAGDALRRDVEHTGLGGEHHQTVLGDPEPAGAQPVAVEHGTDVAAVGEAHRRGAVPRLHDRGVVLVERAPFRRHGGVVLPRLRDHHQHRVRQRAATQVQQLEHLVEAGRVALVLAADRQQVAHLTEQLGGRACPGAPPSSCGCRGRC